MRHQALFAEIRQLIARDELPAALEKMQHLLGNDPKLMDAIHQSGRFYHIKREIMRGTVSHAEATLTQNQIRFGLLELLQEIEEINVGKVQNSSGFSINTSSSMKSILYFLSAVIALLAIWFLFQWYKAEPDNREPLPALLSAVSSLLLLFIAWRLDGQNMNQPSHGGDNRHVEQHGDKSVYIEKNEGDINIH